MSEFSVGDRVRVLGPHGNTVAKGEVMGFSAKDRTHVSKRVKGRRLALVKLDGCEGLARLAYGELRREKP